MTVRAKFVVSGKYKEGDVTLLKAYPVYGASPENKFFWDATPNGSRKLTVTNGSLDELGNYQEFYLDLTPIPKES